MATSSLAYKRVPNWNSEIIQPINELATNPPSGCDPVSTLPEASTDHLFTRQDIEDVHAKLEEICPDNDFAPLEASQLSTVALIQEIEDAIAEGWCSECDEEVTAEEWELGRWTAAKASGTNNSAHCCGISVEHRDFLSAYTGYDVIIYDSPYYYTGQYTVSNSANWAIAQSTYTTARNNSVLWSEYREIELRQQRVVEQKAEELQGLNGQLVILQAQLAAGQPVQPQIDAVQQQISSVTAEMNEAKSERDDAKSEAEGYLALADEAATQNWAALAALDSWDIHQINIISLIQTISYPWGVGEYPFNYSQSFWGVGYRRTSITTGYTTTGNLAVGKFTPSGLPYSRSGPMTWGADWVEYRQSKHCNGLWDVPHLGALGECSDFEPYELDSALPSVVIEGDQLELNIGVTLGTEPAEDYEPDP
jgi:hypothetical protein